MTRYKVGTIIFGILTAIMAMVLIGQIQSGEPLIPIFVVGGAFVCLGLYNAVMWVKTNKPGAVIQLAQTIGKSVDGLPVPAGVIVTITLFGDKIDFITQSGGFQPQKSHYNLDLEKIQKVTLLDSQQIKQIVTQSAPGMIIGAAAFGILGAMVGGRVKTKEKTKISTLLLVDYISDGENKQILIDVSDNFISASTFLSKFNKVKPQLNQTVQL